MDETKYTEIDGVAVIQDEDEMVEALRHNESFAHWEYGDSMNPIFLSSEYCIIDPIKDISEVKPGDAVFCRLHGDEYWQTHLCWIKNEASGECLIGNTHGNLFGWTNQVLGIARRTKDRVMNN